jgi:cell division septation protein DedD
MTGENEQQEIVLGNKQLLSIFFLVVAMMGVAFTIGYIIGRNTAGVSAAGGGQTAAAPRTVGEPPAGPPPDNATPASDAPKTEESRSAAAEHSGADHSGADHSGADQSRADQSSGTQPAKPYETASAKPAAKDEPAPKSDAAADTGAPSASPAKAAPASTTAGGSYLQVAAVKRQDGDHLVEVLRKRGYPALLGESPKEGLFRVLVGPFPDMATLADSKQKLRAAGFEPVVAK